MVALQIQLPESLNEFVQAQITAGRSTSANDYLRDLIAADREQQELLSRLAASEQVQQQLQIGMESGEGRLWSPSALAEHKQRVLSRAGQNS